MFRQTLLLLLLISTCIFALYEEEAGRIDWSQSFIGTIEHVHIPTSQGNKVAYVTTKNHALAALNLRSGEIEWRKVLSRKEEINAFLATGADTLLTVSGGCSMARLWNLQGQLLWEQSVAESRSQRCHVKLHNQYVAILSERQVAFLNSATGAALWKTPIENDALAVAIVNQEASTTLQVLTLDQMDKVIMAVTYLTLDALSGQIKDRKTHALTNPMQTSDIAWVNGQYLVLLDKRDQKLVIVSGNSHFVVNSEIALVNAQISDGEKNEFYIRDSVRRSVTRVVVQDSSAKFEAVNAALVLQQVQVSVKDGKTIRIQSPGQKDQDIEFDVNNHGYPTAVYVQNIASGSRVLLQCEDGSVSVIQSSKLLWTREEALADIESTTFVDLPVLNKLPHVERAIAAFSTRIQYQINQAKELVNFLIEQVTKKDLSTKPQSKHPYRDKYAFDKYILVTTKEGKNFALHTRDGSIVWSMFYRTLFTQATALDPNSIQLFITKAHPEQDTLVAVVCRAGNDQTLVATLNAVTGEVVRASQALPFSHTAAAVYATDLHEEGPIVLFDSQQNAHLVPEQSTSATKRIYFHQVNTKTGSVAGYTWVNGEKQAKQVWSMQFKNQIMAYAKHDNSAVHSVVHVTGSGHVLHKYINPHLIGVATLNQENQLARSLDVYLIDSVTGETVYHTSHPYSEGPVHLAIDDNLVFYHYTNQKTKRYEAAIIELYSNDTSIEQSLVSALVHLNSRSKDFSAYQLPKPFALRQSYVFPTGISAVGISKTKLGITSKQMLFGLTSGQILAMNKKIMDARRPLGAATAADAEEGLAPYDPYLPFDAKSIVSYNKTIHSIDRIVSSPSNLESTAHVFVQGLDLFYTRVSPSLAYDLLNEDFSYVLLLATVAGLMVVTLIARWYASKKELQRMWS
jgi:hypothetical protein